VVSGITVAMVVVVVGAGAVVATTVVGVVVAVVTLAELPHPAIPNAPATRSRANARRRGTRFPFEVAAQHDLLPSTIGSPQTSPRARACRYRNFPKTWSAEKCLSDPDDLGFQARRQRADAHKMTVPTGSHSTHGGIVSISSTDAFWNALSDYDTGSALATNEGNPTGAAATTSATDPSATSATSAASAQAGTMLSLLSGPSSSATPSSAGTLLSQVLSGKSSSAAVAVTSAINQSILDTLL
jgi:hypothetical protein